MHNPTPLFLAAVLAGGCGSMYYATMEKFGYAKRDLLVERVQEAKASQSEAKEQIQTTFEAFQSLTGFSGGSLEAKYKELKAKCDASKSRADKVAGRITSIEKVSKDMFTEWGQEISQIENPGLRAKSEQLKADTEQRYQGLIGAMRGAETRMAPVLTAFNDQVLFLKHNLNAQAISSLQSEVGKIEGDVASLITEMQRSIDEADKFIASMSSDEAAK